MSLTQGVTTEPWQRIMNKLHYGELILAVRPSGMRSLFKLREDGVFRQSVPHRDIMSQNSSQVIIDKCTFRRPTLSEYTLVMKRMPTPCYPKDVNTMVALLDVGEGSRVLEAGTGSGSLTLHLSRAGAYVVPLFTGQKLQKQGQ